MSASATKVRVPLLVGTTTGAGLALGRYSTTVKMLPGRTFWAVNWSCVPTTVRISPSVRFIISTNGRVTGTAVTGGVDAVSMGVAPSKTVTVRVPTGPRSQFNWPDTTYAPEARTVKVVWLVT